MRRLSFVALFDERLYGMTAEQLNRYRAGRTALVTVAMFGQGMQYSTRPDRPLHADSYSTLVKIGNAGWMLLGFVLVALSLAMVSSRLRPYAHGAAAAVYLLLLWAMVTAWYFPTLPLVVGGLNCIELYMWVRHRDKG